ncbi:MAG TPA: DUF4367 domain-containing protein, partial [Anaerovoracaceae bacterium]|nr:DUF4367 domain-containing protein [Anaerovoracaceae bacterium]
MTGLEEEYRKTITERADAFMKYVATIIAEEYEKEFEEIEKEVEEAGIEVPPELDLKMRQMIREFEKKERNHIINQRLKAMGKIVAVVLLCLAVAGTVLVATVDAFRTRVMDFLLKDHGEYMDVKVVETGYIPDEIRSRLPEEWEDVFYPAILPQGYEFADAYEMGESKTILFADENQNIISFSYGPTSEGQTMIDSEDSEVGRLEIDGSPAVYFMKEERTILYWDKDGFSFGLTVYLPLEKAIEIA